jgi:hypothetical protein
MPFNIKNTINKGIGALADRYTDKDGTISWKNVGNDALMASTAYAALNPNDSETLDSFMNPQQQFGGYQGGVPNYTASRELLPDAFATTYTDPTTGEVTARRPGSAGRRYFTDTTFTPDTLEPIMGKTAVEIAAENEQNLTNQAMYESLMGDAFDTRVANEATEAEAARIAEAEAATAAEVASVFANIPVDGDYNTREVQQVMDGLNAGTITTLQAANYFGVDESVVLNFMATQGAGTTFPEGTDGNGVVSNSVLDGFGEVVNDGTVDPVMSIWNDTLTEDREDDPRNWPSARLKQAVLDGSMDYNSAYKALGVADAVNPFGFTDTEQMALGIHESQRTGQGYKLNPATRSMDLYDYDAGAWVGDTAGASTVGGASTADVVDTITADNAAELDTFGTVAGIKAQEDIDALMAGITAEKWTAGDVAEQFNVPELDVLEELLRSGFYGSEDNAIADAAAGASMEEENLVVQLLRAGKTNFAEVAAYYQDQYPGITAAQVEANYNNTEFAQGGNVNGYYLGGTTDGMADQVPATIDNMQPAALSDGEFVIPADVVGHLGNGNSDAGAQNLYSMMERVRKDRTGNPEQGRQIDPNKYLA